MIPIRIVKPTRIHIRRIQHITRESLLRDCRIGGGNCESVGGGSVLVLDVAVTWVGHCGGVCITEGRSRQWGITVDNGNVYNGSNETSVSLYS